VDIFKKMRNVPFGQSQYQLTNFNEKERPERQYRHLLLQLDKKYRALKECEFRRKRIDIDIEEIHEKLKTETGFSKARLEIDLEEKEYQLESEKKLIEDALIEVATLQDALNKLPDFTREQFEQAERGYWRERLLGDARREQISIGTVTAGTLAALEQTGLIVGRNANGQLAYEEAKNDILCINQTH
jgi:hypothetical protein